MLRRVFNFPLISEQERRLGEIQNRATLLHVFLWETPFLISANQCFDNGVSLIPILRGLSEKIDEAMQQDKRIGPLVNIVKKYGNLVEMTVSNYHQIQECQMTDFFETKKKLLFNIAIF